jgi:hypothetical protein
MKTFLNTILGIAGVLGICWLLSPRADWISWAAVFLQLAGIFTAVLGIIKTRYGFTPSEFLRRLYNRAFLPPVTGEGRLQAGSATISGQGYVTTSAHRNLDERVDALEKRVDTVKAGLEESIRRQGEELREEMRQRDTSLETWQRDREKRMKDEIFEQHGLEVIGLAWLAVGILLSGPFSN